MKTSLIAISSFIVGLIIGVSFSEKTDVVYYCPSSTIVKAYQDSVASGATCAPLLTQPLKTGDQNGYVMLLQKFLIDDGEQIAAGVTGLYGAQTRAAVNDFQLKYSAYILAPQNLTNPTGVVRAGTIAQINAIHCNQ